MTGLAAQDVITLELPEPPSANRYWRLGRSGRSGFGGHLHRSDEADLYRQTVFYRVHQRAGVLATGQPFFPDQPLTLSMHWFRSRRSGDLDNRLKVLLDALKQILYTDDAQIVELHAYRLDPTQGMKGIVRVAVSAWTPTELRERFTSSGVVSHD